MYRHFLSPLIALLAILITLSTAPVSAQKKKATAKSAVKTAQSTEATQYADSPICQVMILDSTVVEKSKLLENLQLPATLGRIFVDDNTGENAYENAFGDQRIISKADGNGHHNIYRQTLLGKTWSEPEPITINGNFIDIVNPFMSPDGTTLFFAARSQSDKTGTSLSLYMTTYDATTQSFLTPTQLPYPFTSASDDMYYIEDDVDSLAWFVSARRQVTGNVCIYTMRIHEPWQYYDTESLTPAQQKSLAIIENISDTWTSSDEHNAAKEQLDAVRKEISEALHPENSDNIRFVGAYDRVYTHLSEFSSDYVRNKYKSLIALEESIQTQERQLDEFRRVYHNSMDGSKDSITKLINESEQKLQADRHTAKLLADEIRKAK